MGSLIRRGAAGRAARLLVTAILTVVFAIPFVWMVTSSFKPRARIFGDLRPLTWRALIPTQPTLENFEVVINQRNFLRPLIVTLVLAVVATLLSLAVNSMAAYALAKIRFPGAKALLWILIGTMFVVFEAKVVPLFRIMQALHLGNSYFSIIAPWITDAFFIFFFYQHFRDVPDDLIEAAEIDGASHLRIYRSIMLPNIKPALISAAIIKMIFSFDVFLWPLLTISDEAKDVTSVAIAKLFQDEGVLWQLVLAEATLTTVPILILFLIFQKQYVEGISGTGLKG